MNRSRMAFAALAVVAVLAALYCFSGYVMNASFSGAVSDPRDYSDAAVAWGGAGIVSLAAAMIFGVLAWRRARSR